jgi:hypothetical protein
MTVRCPICGIHVPRHTNGVQSKHCGPEHALEARYRRVLARARVGAPQRQSPMLERALHRLEAEAALPLVTGPLALATRVEALRSGVRALELRLAGGCR